MSSLAVDTTWCVLAAASYMVGGNKCPMGGVSDLNTLCVIQRGCLHNHAKSPVLHPQRSCQTLPVMHGKLSEDTIVRPKVDIVMVAGRLQLSPETTGRVARGDLANSQICAPSGCVAKRHRKGFPLTMPSAHFPHNFPKREIIGARTRETCRPSGMCNHSRFSNLPRCMKRRGYTVPPSRSGQVGSAMHESVLISRLSHLMQVRVRQRFARFVHSIAPRSTARRTAGW